MFYKAVKIMPGFVSGDYFFKTVALKKSQMSFSLTLFFFLIDLIFF